MSSTYPTPSSLAAAASSPARTRPRSPTSAPRVDASPWVKHSTDVELPDSPKAASAAPSPKLSSSGCAHTTSTERASGNSSSSNFVGRCVISHPDRRRRVTNCPSSSLKHIPYGVYATVEDDLLGLAASRRRPHRPPGD